MDDGEAQALAGDERAEAGEALGGVRVRLLLGGEETEAAGTRGRGGRFGRGERARRGEEEVVASARARNCDEVTENPDEAEADVKAAEEEGDPGDTRRATASMRRATRARRYDRRRNDPRSGEKRPTAPVAALSASAAMAHLSGASRGEEGRVRAGPTDARGGRTAPGDDARGTNHARIRETREVCVTRPSEPVGRSGDVSREAGAR